MGHIVENLALEALTSPALDGLLARVPPGREEDVQVIDFMDILSDQTTRIADQENTLAMLGGVLLNASPTPAEMPAQTTDGHAEGVPQTALMDVLAALPVPAGTAPAIPAPAPVLELQYSAASAQTAALGGGQADTSLHAHFDLLRQAPAPMPAAGNTSALDTTVPAPGRIESTAIDAPPPAAPMTALSAVVNAGARPPASSEHADRTAGLRPSTTTRALNSPAPASTQSPVAEGASVQAHGEAPVSAPATPAAPPALLAMSGPLSATTQPHPLPAGGALAVTRPAIAVLVAKESAPDGAPDKHAADSGLLAAAAHTAPVNAELKPSFSSAHDVAVSAAATPTTVEAHSELPQTAPQASVTASATSPTPPTPPMALMSASAPPPRAEAAPPPAPYATTYSAPTTHVYVETPVHSAGWSSALGERVAWLMDHGQHKARLHIDPEHLGPIDVTLTLKGNEVGIAFSTAQAELRGVLDLALPQLRDTLAQGGVQLGSTTISNGSQGSAQDTFGAPARQRGHAPAAAHGDDLPAPAPRPARASLGLLDTYA